MDETISILIADDNIEFANLLYEYLRQQQDINVSGMARDGLEAVDMLRCLSPDVVILDIIMPGLDGIGVLERASKLKLVKKPIFIMLSAVGQDMFTQKALALGAEYYMVKPCDIEVLLMRIREIFREKSVLGAARISNVEKISSKPLEQVWDLEVEVTNLLRVIGIPPHMVGYRYLREAIIFCINNTKDCMSVTRVIYPKVAEKFNSNPQKVERAIRNAIETAWSRRGRKGSDDLILNGLVDFSKWKPTNSELIATLSDYLRVQFKIK